MAIEDEIQRLVSEACQKVVEEQALGFENLCDLLRVNVSTSHKGVLASQYGFVQEVKFKELQDKFQDGSSSLVKGPEGRSGQLNPFLASNKSAVETLADGIRQELQTATSELKERLDRIQDDPDGEGGVKQLRSQVTAFSEEIKGFRNEIEENGRKTKSCKSDTDDMRIKVAECIKMCKDSADAADSAEAKLKEMEERCNQVQERQKVVEDSVAGKYSELWKDVLHALEKMKSEMLQLVQEDPKQGSKCDLQSQMKYVSKLISSVHNDRRKLAVAKQFLTFWQHYTWTEVRRKIGLSMVGGFFRRRTQQALHRWVHHTSIENMKTDLRKEYSELIPDVPKAIEASGLPDTCIRLEGELETARKDLEDIKASVGDYGAKIEQTETRASAEVTGAEELSSRLQQVAEDLEGYQSQASEAISQLEAGIEDTRRFSKKLEEDQQLFAKTQEVKEVQSDIARFWLCIKTLDTAKANKTDMDSFALETRNMHKQSSRHMQDLEGKVSDKVKEETIRMQEKCSELDCKVDERGKQLEQMTTHMDNQWQRLAVLVDKLASEQQMLVTQGVSRTTRPVRPPSAQRLPRNGSPTGLTPIDISLREQDRDQNSRSGRDRGPSRNL